jgi:hypothetical protein
MTCADSPSPVHRYCGRDFTAEEIDRIRKLIAARPPLNRAQLSRRVCDELHWLRPDGSRKDMSCRVAMLRMERDGLIRLPAPLCKNANGRIRPKRTDAGDPAAPLQLPLHELGTITLCPVRSRKDSALWNELIERYHYLGYKPLPGAQLRYLVRANGDRWPNPPLLAALGFGAAAWMVAPRDRFIGWTAPQRKRNLHLVVNNARFLILPWVQVQNLASSILARVAKRIAGDWKEGYGFQPVLLETFVETERFHGTAYRAANWLHVGQTQGRGKLNKAHIRLEPIKDIYLYPLTKRFRKTLCQTP